MEEEQESLIAVATSTDTVIDIRTEEPKRPLFRELLSIPVLQAVFASSAALGFAGSCFNSVFVLMAYSPINEGGLALSVRPLSPVSPSSTHAHFRTTSSNVPPLLRVFHPTFEPLRLKPYLTTTSTALSHPHLLLPPPASLIPLRAPPPALALDSPAARTHAPTPPQPSQIGRALSGMGAVSIVLKLGMPALLRRFGTLAMFDFCMYAWIAAFASLPLASWVARAATAAVNNLNPNLNLRDAGTGEWLSIGFVLFLSRLGCLAFS